MKFKTPPPQGAYVVERKDWPQGEWDWEPDRLEWRRGSYVCLLRRRQRFGYWCGYVAVPNGHPWYGHPANMISARVHGSLNHAGPCEPAEFICHDPVPGDPDDVWWVGFDCGYGADIRPGLLAIARAVMPGFRREIPKQAVYRNVQRSKIETINLADQADAAWHNSDVLTPPTGFHSFARAKPRRWTR